MFLISAESRPHSEKQLDLLTTISLNTSSYYPDTILHQRTVLRWWKILKYHGIITCSCYHSLTAIKLYKQLSAFVVEPVRVMWGLRGRSADSTESWKNFFYLHICQKKKMTVDWISGLTPTVQQRMLQGWGQKHRQALEQLLRMQWQLS